MAEERRPGGAVPCPEAALLDSEQRHELLAVLANLSDTDRPMTPDGVRTFANTPELSVGARSRPYRCLRHADPAAQDAKISSRDDLAARLGVAPAAFSFGFPGADFDDSVMSRMRAAGFSLS